MRFINDSQRRAVFANMFSRDRVFARGRKDRGIISDEMIMELRAPEPPSVILDTERRAAGIGGRYRNIRLLVKDLPEGAQGFFPVTEFDTVAAAKEAAEEAAELVESEGIKTEVLPVWKEGDIVGYTFTAWESARGRPRRYFEKSTMAVEFKEKEE
jgi:hypothetical protein